MANRSNFAEPGTGTGNRTKNFKLEQGSNRYRIGPAYASLAASGRWNHNIRQHYGYKGAEDAQTGKSFPRTFICPQEIDRKTEIVKVPCAECDDTAQLSEKVELRAQKLEQEGKSEEDINTVLGPQKKYLKEHNLDKKHLVLAKNESNEWGVLWLPWKALEALIARRKKIQEEDGVDILSTVDGCWVDFVRSGDGFRNTAYACDVVSEIVLMENGKKAKMPKQEALTDADFDAIEATCPDLTTVGTRLTSEQIERLVESRGDPEVVDAVFNEARETKKGRKEASPSPAPTATVKNRPAPKVEAKEVDDVPENMMGASKSAAAVAHEAVPEVDEEAALLAQLAAARAKKAAAAKAVEVRGTFKELPPDVEVTEKVAPKKVTPKPEPEPEISPDVDPDTLSDDQFMKVYGKK